MYTHMYIFSLWSGMETGWPYSSNSACCDFGWEVRPLPHVALCGLFLCPFSFDCPGVFRSCFRLFPTLLPVSIRFGLRCFWLVYDEQGHVVNLYSGRFNPICHELRDRFKFRFSSKTPFLFPIYLFPGVWVNSR
jgi:hypothetical protein